MCCLVEFSTNETYIKEFTYMFIGNTEHFVIVRDARKGPISLCDLILQRGICRETSGVIKQISVFLGGHILNVLYNELSRSAWQNLGLNREYRTNRVRSVLTTSVTISPVQNSCSVNKNQMSPYHRQPSIGFLLSTRYTFEHLLSGHPQRIGKWLLS